MDYLEERATQFDPENPLIYTNNSNQRVVTEEGIGCVAEAIAALECMIE